MILDKLQTKLAEELSVLLGKTDYYSLMENAGRGVTKVILGYLQDKGFDNLQNTLILVGNGNNGGDGLVVARLLSEQGKKVTLLLTSAEPTTKDSITNYSRIDTGKIPIYRLEELSSKDLDKLVSQSAVIVDSVYGIGFRGSLTTSLSALFKSCNQATAYKVAMDIPSGVECDISDSHSIDPNCFKADCTATFSTLKPAHTIKGLYDIMGEVTVIDIGIEPFVLDLSVNSPTVIDHDLIKSILPKRRKDSNKGDYGKLLNISGSRRMGGAALMSTLAALRCGAGITALASTEYVCSIVAPHIMEAMTLPLQNKDGFIAFSENIDLLLDEIRRYSAVIIGCGLGQSGDVKLLVGRLLREYEGKIILDADGINSVNDNINILTKAKAELVITPHPGEFARLCGSSIPDVKRNGASIAKAMAIKHNLTVVLKGENTVIALPDGTVYLNTTGNAGLAKGGSGDVLSGMIGSFCAMGLSCSEAAVCGVHLHGLCADNVAKTTALHSVLARDIIENIKTTLKDFE